MADQSESNEPVSDTREPEQEGQVFHSLGDLPASVGQISRGPLGAVSRRDHTSWKSKNPTDPGYWCGRIDSAIGARINPNPVTSIAMCLGLGLILGLSVKRHG